jgi:hypothetical protein
MLRFTLAKSPWRRIQLLVWILIVAGCGPSRCRGRTDVPPEEQLRAYLDLAVNITRMEQREELESYTTGDFLDNLSSASPEAFKKNYLDRRYEFEVFEVTGKSEVEPKKEIRIEYRVKYKTWLTGEDKTRSPVQEVRSIATMKYVNGQWVIAEVTPVDSEYSWEVGLPMEGVSTEGVSEDSPVVNPFEESNEVPEQQKNSGGSAVPEGTKPESGRQ